MAQELYVSKILTNEMVTTGKQFLKQIETVMPVTASFWLYTSDTEVWNLYIVTPFVLTGGSRKVYEEALGILKAQQERKYTLPLLCITATDDNDFYVSSLRMMRLSDKTFDERLTGIGITGSRYIEDAYIYRLYANAEASHSQAADVNRELAAVMA